MFMRKYHGATPLTMNILLKNEGHEYKICPVRGRN
jgi:hypothetical protein